MSSKNSNRKQRAIFLHLPKTAGITLHQIIERQYPPQNIYSIDPANVPESIQEFKNLSAARRAEIRMLKGHLHMSFALHESLPESAYFTVLRDPVDRVISHYYFALGLPEEHLQGVTRKDLQTYTCLKELLEQAQVIMWNNAQTRLLAGIWYDVGFGECTQETLETAKRNLREHFSIVGLTERFDETLLLLKSAYGWQKSVCYTRKNVTPNRPARNELPSSDLEAIIEANQLDIQLYQYAATLFEEQLRQQGSLFPLKVKIFQSKNRLYNSRVYREIRKRSLRTFIRRWSLRVFIRKWTRRILGSR